MFPLSTIKSYQEIVDQNGLKSRSLILKKVSHVLVPDRLRFDSPQINAQLIVRERIVSGKPTILDYNYINESVIPNIPLQPGDSLFNYFEEKMVYNIDYAVKHLTVEAAEYDDCH